MSVTAAIRELMEAGFTADQALLAAEICEKQMAQPKPARSANAEACARYRQRTKQESDVATCRDMSDMSGSFPEQKVPTPLKTQTLSPKENPPKGGQKKGCRLPADWLPSESETTFAVEQGIPSEKVPLVVASYRDYWAGVPGVRGCKLDWPATWRNWCRTEAPKHRPRSQSPPPWAPPAANHDRVLQLALERQRQDEEGRAA